MMRFFFSVVFFFLLSIAPQVAHADTPIKGPNCGGVTSPFGLRIPPKNGASRNHPGVDYGCNNSALYAGVKGGITCKSKADGNGAGNRCHLEYSCIRMSYFHMSDGGFKSGGKSVVLDQGIGTSGNTGNSTGPHLHYEFRVSGVPMDAVSIFAQYQTAEQICNPNAVEKLLDEREKQMSKPVNSNDDPNAVTVSNHGEQNACID